jgi:hypothetical protein
MPTYWRTSSRTSIWLSGTPKNEEDNPPDGGSWHYQVVETCWLPGHVAVGHQVWERVTICHQLPGATHGTADLDVVGVAVAPGRVVGDDDVGAYLSDDTPQVTGHVFQVGLIQAGRVLIVGGTFHAAVAVAVAQRPQADAQRAAGTFQFQLPQVGQRQIRIGPNRVGLV